MSQPSSHYININIKRKTKIRATNTSAKENLNVLPATKTDRLES